MAKGREVVLGNRAPVSAFRCELLDYLLCDGIAAAGRAHALAPHASHLLLQSLVVQQLPEAATQYFSPYFLWSRLPKDDSETVSSTVLAAFEDYLRTYLELVAEATPLDNAAALGGVREAQLSYARYRAESDPARPMLTRLFGGEFAERLIREVLFDLPLRLDEEHSSAAHGAADTRWRRSYDGRAA